MSTLARESASSLHTIARRRSCSISAFARSENSHWRCCTILVTTGCRNSQNRSASKRWTSALSNDAVWRGFAQSYSTLDPFAGLLIAEKLSAVGQDESPDPRIAEELSSLKAWFLQTTMVLPEKFRPAQDKLDAVTRGLDCSPEAFSVNELFRCALNTFRSKSARVFRLRSVSAIRTMLTEIAIKVACRETDQVFVFLSEFPLPGRTVADFSSNLHEELKHDPIVVATPDSTADEVRC